MVKWRYSLPSAQIVVTEQPLAWGVVLKGGCRKRDPLLFRTTTQHYCLSLRASLTQSEYGVGVHPYCTDVVDLNGALVAFSCRLLASATLFGFVHAPSFRAPWRIVACCPDTSCGISPSKAGDAGADQI